MKKVSLMLGALALVLGISQCKKQESPVQAGEKQYIEVTAYNGNDGSKVNVDFASVPTVMNLTWEKGDVITVSGGAEGTLTLDEGAETAHGHFSGEIEKKNDNELVFSYKKAAQERGDENPNLPDFSAQDGTETWIENNLYLETKAAYNESGNYRVLMEMPYAVLKLDVSTLVGTQNDVTIKAGDVPVVTFESLAKADAEEMFVAVPADGTEQTYTFIGNDKIVGKTWTLAASTYYTAEGGNAVVAEPAHAYVDLGLPSGRLWATCNMGADSPEGYGWYFMWGSVTEGGDPKCSWKRCPGNGGSSSYDEDAFIEWEADNLTGRVLNPDVDVATANWGGDWRMPTKADWQELYDNTTSEWTTENGVAGRKFTSTKEGYTDKYIFLPAAGYRRNGSSLYDVGSIGVYWSSSLHSSRLDVAVHLNFDSGSAHPDNYSNRHIGCTVRPVR